MMSLGLSLNIASSGLQNVEAGLATTSKNVTNASTEGYVSENAVSTSAVISGKGTGVTTGNNTLHISPPLQAALYRQNANVSGLTTMSNSLSSLSAVQGTTSSSSGDTNTIGTLTNTLQNVTSSLTTLTNNPRSSAAHSTVIGNAQTLVSNISTLSSVYQSQRQGAQDGIVSTVAGINSDVTTIGQVSKQIMLMQGTGKDTSDLENKRFESMSRLSSKLGVSFSEQPNGDMIVNTQDGMQIPTRPDQINQSDSSQSLPSSGWPLTTSNATLSPGMYYKQGDTNGGVPAISINGRDATNHLTGGTLGANLTLRDNTYPGMQAQLDSFSYTMVNRFNAAGLPLFSNGTSQPLSSDPTKTAPNGTVGLSSSLAVNQQYVDKPSLLTTNKNGDTADTTAVTNALGQALGTTSSAVTGKLAAPTDSLGPTGSFSTGYSGEQGLSQLASSLTSNQALTISNTSSNLSTASSVKTSLSTQVSNVSGVNVDNQMANVITLQNAYSANAKVISAVQSMFSALINAVQ
ncbi:flagellar hook-associated protein FlgK [Saccharibacter floricola]|uniref:Flagellar hook-associated protein 1 n=1 Tax=Saccharibacter floricola DSM 15669 TaxID=1123227 RepID=A0ABQ0NXJ9_9PROT|nr:flagellar hook-associated protein FlgK [Saccharibacter floricola]GBQ05890.1 flagellar hook-associated protein FlgK [Saccharibacter floricola DSM 15669]